MATKIWWQNVITSQERAAEVFGEASFEVPPQERILPAIEHVMRDDTVVERQDMERSSYVLSDSYMDMLNNAVTTRICWSEMPHFTLLVGVPHHG